MGEKGQRDYDIYEFFDWYDQFQRPCNVVTNAKRKRQGNEMFSSQHDCIIDDDETISSNDQGSCNDAETPNRNTCKNNSKQLRCNYKN